MFHKIHTKQMGDKMRRTKGSKAKKIGTAKNPPVRRRWLFERRRYLLPKRQFLMLAAIMFRWRRLGNAYRVRSRKGADKAGFQFPVHITVCVRGLVRISGVFI